MIVSVSDSARYVSPGVSREPRKPLANASPGRGTAAATIRASVPSTPADRVKGTPAVYGNMQMQAESAFGKIQSLLKEQGLGMGDVVMMRVYMAADPADNKLDFAGMNAAYAKFFGTLEQPNKPARAAVQVAALVAQRALLEVEVQAARSSSSPGPTK